MRYFLSREKITIMAVNLGLYIKGSVKCDYDTCDPLELLEFATILRNAVGKVSKSVLDEEIHQLFEVSHAEGVFYIEYEMREYQEIALLQAITAIDDSTKACA